MRRSKANAIVNEFFRDANPSFWDGKGNKPSVFYEGIWEYPLTEKVRLEITLVHDDIDGWHHCCDLVDTESNDSLDMLSGYGIDSALNMVDTIMDLCRNCEAE